MEVIKISIITINFNNSKGLVQTLDSVAQQTYNNYEHIIIDGASTDGSKSIIEQYKNKNPHVTYWVSEKDEGIYNAMNKGITHAQGQYLLFLNSGDYIEPNILEQAATSLTGTDIIYGNLYFISESGHKYLRIYPESPLSAALLLSPTFCLPHPATFIRRELFKDQLYNEQYKIISDWEFWIKSILFKNRSTKHINLNISNFHEGGISSNTTLANKERTKILSDLFPQKVLEELSEFLLIKESPLYEGFFLMKHAKHFQKKINKLIIFCYKIRCKFLERH